MVEVTALAMNSTPTGTLRNTCAGITELNIFKLPVRIFTTQDEEGEGEGGYLELVFYALSEEKAKDAVIVPNRVSGTMPCKAKQS